MKIKKKLIVNQNKLLTIRLIKNKFFKNKKNKSFYQIKLGLKKKLKIIFQFFSLNKKMLFLNLNLRLNFFFLNWVKNTKHLYLTENYWFKGILTNSNMLFKHLILSKYLSLIIKFLFNLIKINLILVFQTSMNNSEYKQFKVPVLSFNYFNKHSCDYFLKISFKFLKNSSLLYFFLNILKIKIQRTFKKKNEKFKY